MVEEKCPNSYLRMMKVRCIKTQFGCSHKGDFKTCSLFKPKILTEYKYEIIRKGGAISSYSMISRKKKLSRLSKWFIKKILGWELKLC